MKNIHLFETKNAYDEAKSELILPRVSYIEENQDIKYNPTFDANGHDFVEIAGIKWATMNVGASSSTDAGLYFQWGDTQGYTSGQVGTSEEQKAFSVSDYKFTTDGGNTFTKYNGTDNKIVLDLVDDAVRANWGGSWRMPTTDEFAKLGEAVTNGTVTKSYTSKNGVNGLLLTEGDKELFFPMCGDANNGSMSNVGSNCRYWSSSLDSSDANNYYKTSYNLFYNMGNTHWQSSDYRFIGKSVRGVLDEN